MTEPKQTVTTKLASKLIDAFNRADEWGGEVRDYVQERVLKDPRYVAARRRVASALGKAYESVGDRAQAAAGAEAVRAAAAPIVAAGPKGPKPLGNIDIKAQIYGKKSCPWSGRAISLLERHKVDFDFVDLEEPEHEVLAPRLTEETHQATVPYVYLRGVFIGGFNALSEVERLGQLEVAMMSPAELEAAPEHVRKVVIAARPNTDEVAPSEDADAHGHDHAH